MTSYRAYRVGQDGHFVGSHIIEAADDDAAKTALCALKIDALFELWAGARAVGHVDCREAVEQVDRRD